MLRQYFHDPFSCHTEGPDHPYKQIKHVFNIQMFILSDANFLVCWKSQYHYYGRTTVYVSLSSFILLHVLSKMHFLISMCIAISGFYCYATGWTKTTLRLMEEKERNKASSRLQVEVQSAVEDREEWRRCSVEVLYDIQLQIKRDRWRWRTVM